MENRTGFDDMLAFLPNPEVSREIVADGELLVDGTRCGLLLVDEHIARH